MTKIASRGSIKLEASFLRPAGGDPGLDHLQKYFFDSLCFLEWTWPFWNPWKTFHEKNVWFKQRKQGEKLFLLWRHSALLVRPFSWLAKNRWQRNPCQYARDWSIRYGRCALPLQAPLTCCCTSRLSCLSSDRRESHWKRNLRQR